MTGTHGPKTRWRIARRGHGWFCIAGLIGRGPDDAYAFALLTVDGGPDVALHKDRQPALVERHAWATWLNGLDMIGGLQPSAAGTLDMVVAPRN